MPSIASCEGISYSPYNYKRSRIKKRKARFFQESHRSTTAETQNQMSGRLLLDVVIGQGATVLQLLAGKDKPLLIGRNTLFVLDLGLDVFNAVRWLHFQRDGLPGQGFDKNLHSSAETQDQVKGRLFLDIVIGQSATVFQLLAGEDKPLLIGRNTFLVLDLGLDILNAV